MRNLFLCLFLANAASAAEVTLHRWSGALNVPDPVACTVDEKGRVYVAATTRRKAADLDIREHPMWIPDDVGLSSVEEKREFLKRELAPGKMRLPRGSLKDHNKDGSIDWKDLTVHSEKIFQLRDTDGDGTADKMTTFAEGFNTEVTGIAAGILYHDGWVYCTIAPDLWRLKDTDDDGVADVREVVAHGFGMHIAYAGHDMHGPRLGLDGRIYWSIGDKGVNVMSKEGKQWLYPHEGAVMRVEPDGSGFEVFAHGLRNVQEVAFDDFGNMFGVDNDADMPGEKERFVYITELSDSGWRCSHQYMKAESRWMRESIWQTPGTVVEADPKAKTVEGAVATPPASYPLFVTPPLANYSNGPAGFVHEPGTALGSHLRGHFILDQFPSGKMEAFKITPKGSAFEMSRARLINSGIMGIGLSFGPDGGLYMADWVGGYPLDEKGAIWRVDEDAKAATDPARVETQKILAAGFKKLEPADLQIMLANLDQRVRLGAQLELASRKEWKVFAETLEDGKAPLLAKLHAIWGIGIGMRHGDTGEAALLPHLTSAEPEVQTQIIKVLGDAPAKAEESRLALPKLIASSNIRVRFYAAIAAGKLQLGAAEDALWTMAAKEAGDAWMRHAVVTGLSGAATAESLAKRISDSSRNVRIAAVLALSRQHSALIVPALADRDSAIVDEAARAIHDDNGISEAMPQLAALLDEDKAHTDVTTRRAINANLRLGKIENAERLLKFALAKNQTPAFAADAFAALLVFTEPPVLDRVDGHNRRYAVRDAAAIAAVVQPRVSDLLALADADLKAAGIELMVKLALKVDAPALRSIIADDKAKATQRVGALRLMAAQHSSDAAFAETLTLAAAKTSPVELRTESLAQTFALQKDRAVAEASRVLEQGSTTEKQAALKLLSKDTSEPAVTLMDTWLQRLAAGKVDASLKLDVIEASQTFPKLAERLAAYQQSRTTAPRDDLLEGGDAVNGKELVTNHLGANCLACHTVEAKEGSQVGPLLKTIGGQRTRVELLESLVNPVAKIVPGYGLVSITLKDGSNIAGALAKEDKATITVRLADGTEKKVQRTQVTMQTPPVSMMPPMLGILTPREVRDVVAYLSSLKPSKGKSAAKAKDEH
ncbi:PVC-type heme-binding CxxCH protein [Brevifollis gellanilyticus]|uniref:Glucose dehydrogenase n=1 Tax=Brevifollis gellanilyticus TaxID=748831 RepID=A0A512MGR6_9BACT|nr:PVC-type heme-binding CxxCH protein [Brevifollis gellanilyticus]GEP45930.1 glucose dehydrogenase [Brevifollis gellanilyticus]